LEIDSSSGRNECFPLMHLYKFKETLGDIESMNHQSLMPSLASLGKIDPSDFFLGCENEGLKLEVRHLNYLVYLMKKN